MSTMHCFSAMNTVRFSGLWLAESFLGNRRSLSLRSIGYFRSDEHAWHRARPRSHRRGHFHFHELEGPRSYIGASVLHLFAAIGIACLYTLIVRFNVAIFAAGLHGRLLFAIAIRGAMSLPIILESALFIHLHPLVVLGQLLDWLTTSLLGCVVTGWWTRS